MTISDATQPRNPGAARRRPTEQRADGAL